MTQTFQLMSLGKFKNDMDKMSSMEYCSFDQSGSVSETVEFDLPDDTVLRVSVFNSHDDCNNQIMDIEIYDELTGDLDAVKDEDVEKFVKTLIDEHLRVASWGYPENFFND